MPIEDRFITFDLSEIYRALSICAIKENQPPLPPGKIVALKINDDDAASKDNIIVDLQKEDGSAAELKFARKFFASALIFYCQGSGIPLPKSGQKFLNVMEDKIVLNIKFNQE